MIRNTVILSNFFFFVSYSEIVRSVRLEIPERKTQRCYRGF
ncbi:hypothetical protein LEP1GSC029_2953 [Leptospira interrogans str. 2002000626]|uniref:Uncharacterized protein n=1 Tax=Leptospira interrogans str. 2002000626 TaxID=996803 RepID=A0A829DAC0_LEPIR|nr:hypothetical protein LEP1GSC029_2953 [Leptospira interrogans str. 2002000626]